MEKIGKIEETGGDNLFLQRQSLFFVIARASARSNPEHFFLIASFLAMMERERYYEGLLCLLQSEDYMITDTKILNKNIQNN